MLSDVFDFELQEEHRIVRSSAAEFAEREVRPLARKIDAEHYFPQELVPKLGAQGFLGITVPEQFGGAGLDDLSYALIIAELARVCASTSVVVSAHNSLSAGAILAFGTDEQKQKYLPALASGDAIGCFALSEPGTGSDAGRQTCMSKRVGTEWQINGVKNWITNAPVSSVGIVFTMEKPELSHKGINCFIIDLKTTEGVSIGKKEDKLGICGSPTASITLENVRVSDSQLLGSPGEGFRIAMKVLESGRCGIAAQAIGIARAALEDSLQYARDRQAFGKPIGEHQSIQNYLADMSTRLDAAWLLTLHACKRKMAGLPFTRQAAQAKLFASEAAMETTIKAVQIHGGYGYVKDFNVERYMRDAKITEIYEGTSEIQRLVIARSLLSE